MENALPMEALHAVLTARREEVILRWKAMVQGTLAPEAMSSIELVDHLPLFLKEVIAALRADVGLPSIAPSPKESQTAADHGEQRLRLGFSLDAVVREYGALRDAILATGKDRFVSSRSYSTRSSLESPTRFPSTPDSEMRSCNGNTMNILPSSLTNCAIPYPRQ